jgi:diadenylate cyclase
MGEKMEEEIRNNLVQQPLSKIEILKKISAGTPLRNAINDIVHGGLGAIIVISNSKTYDCFQGGFKVDCEFTQRRLIELAKMDGAIILSPDFKRILYANTLLTPNTNLPSSETGIRHQAGERTAKETHSLVIVVSQRRGETTIFNDTYRYLLQPTEDLLRRASENLQLLEKQREIFDDLLINLNILELTDLVSIGDICKILQRIEMIKKMNKIVHEQILELGEDGIILKMRMKEVIRGIDLEDELITKDYIKNNEFTKKFLESLNFEEILDVERIAINLFNQPQDQSINAKGFRILSKTTLHEETIESLIREFETLDKIINADHQVLIRTLGTNVNRFHKEISHLREQILVGKKV